MPDSTLLADEHLGAQSQWALGRMVLCRSAHGKPAPLSPVWVCGSLIGSLKLGEKQLPCNMGHACILEELHCKGK